MIRKFFAALVGCLMLAQMAAADTRDVYTIRDIEVDEIAPTLIEARDAAMATARLAGAQRLIEKITLEEDRMAAGGVIIDPALAEQFAAAVDVQEETAGAGRYKGTLSVVYNPRLVRAHLDTLGVPYVDTQAPLGLLVPLTSDIAADVTWREVLGERNMNPLAPYVTAQGPDYSFLSDWFELSPEATAMGARRGILAELGGVEGSWRITVSTVTAIGTEVLGTTYRAETLEDATAGMIRILGEDWKKRSVIRGSTRTQAGATVRYTSLAEWNTLRGALARSPLVSDLKITAIARDGAVVSFAFAGDPPRLQDDLLQRGVFITQEDDEWVVRSAVSSSGGQ